MFDLLKIIHMLSLAVGIGGGMSSAIMAAKAMPQAPAVVGPVMKLISRIGVVAIILLWITGLWMLSIKFPGADLGIWFWLKMLGATGLTGGALFYQYLSFFAPAKVPALGPKLGPLMMASAIVAVIFAVVTFN